VCFAIDNLILEPLKIWINCIVASSLVDEEIRACLGLLRDRTEYLLQRTRGSMTNANCIIQHLNPVCRVARYYPRLPISRILLSLNDADIPIEFAVPSKPLLMRLERLLCLGLHCFCLLLPSFPLVIQDAFNEIWITACLWLLVAASAFIVAYSWYILLIPAVFILPYITIREFIARSRKKNFKSCLKAIEISKCNKLDSLISSEGSSLMYKWFISLIGFTPHTPVNDMPEPAVKFQTLLSRRFRHSKSFNSKKELSKALNKEWEYQKSYDNLNLTAGEKTIKIPRIPSSSELSDNPMISNNYSFRSVSFHDDNHQDQMEESSHCAENKVESCLKTLTGSSIYESSIELVHVSNLDKISRTFEEENPMPLPTRVKTGLYSNFLAAVSGCRLDEYANVDEDDASPQDDDRRPLSLRF